MARASSLVSEPILMTLPWPRAIMRLAASRPIMKADVRLVSITRCQSAVASSTIGLRNWMPALLTRMSTVMPAASKVPKARTISASLVTLNGAGSAAWPAAWNCDTVSATRSGSVPLIRMRAPATASPSAMARPSPREEPVTSAVLPVRSKRGLVMSGPHRLERRTVRSERSNTAGRSSTPSPGPSIGRT